MLIVGRVEQAAKKIVLTDNSFSRLKITSWIMESKEKSGTPSSEKHSSAKRRAVDSPRDSDSTSETKNVDYSLLYSR